MGKALKEIQPIGFPVILVGGTNGKGSVCKHLHDFFRSEGMKTGLTTSPHLRDVRERIIIDGHMISEAEFDVLFQEADRDATYFETLALMAIAHFKKQKVDVAVVEIGMGGRLDAFNALSPAVSVITTIGLEHQQHLGNSCEEIAIEKAQIARAGRPVILGSRLPLEEVERIGARPLLVEPEVDFQKHNIDVAIAAAGAFCGEIGKPFDEAACREVCAKTYWPARFEVIPGRPEIILDAAHNMPAAEALARRLKDHVKGRKLVALVAFLSDKDAPGFFISLDRVVDQWIVTEVKHSRARALLDVPAPYNSERIADSAEALEAAKRAAGPHGIVLVTGSIYLLGEILGGPLAQRTVFENP